MNGSPVLSIVDNPQSPFGKSLAIDGVVDNGSYVQWQHLSQKASHWLMVQDPKVAERVLECPVAEFSAHFDGVIMPLSNAEPIERVHISWQAPTSDPSPDIWFSMPLDLRAWSHSWSPSEFVETLQSVVARVLPSEVKVIERAYLTNGPGVLKFKIDPRDARIQDVIQRHLPTARRLIRASTRQLQQRRDRKVILEVGPLPQDVRYAIHQYLLYLYRFLSDAGMAVPRDVQFQEARTLITLTPTSQTQALRQINQALRLYLHLPLLPPFCTTALAAPAFPTTPPQAAAFRAPPSTASAALLLPCADSGLARIELPATVARLRRSMLRLAHRIEILETAPYRYTIQSSPSQPEAASEDKEPLIKDLLYVEPYERFKIRIDSPRIARDLKKLWHRWITRRRN
jgi:hypothetical protein